MSATIAEIAKALAALITAAIGAAAEAITLSLVHGDAAKWVTIGIGAATAISSYLTVYLAPSPPPPAVPAVPPGPD